MTSDFMQGGTQRALHITPGGAMQASATAQFLLDLGQFTWLSMFMRALLVAGILASAPSPQNPAGTLWSEAQTYHGLIPSNGIRNSTVAAAYAKLTGKGFHSRIQYTLSSQEAVAEGACQITVLQALPAGVFADPYELANIARMPSKQKGCYLQLSVYHVFGPSDVEKIEPECQPTLLSVSAEVQLPTSSSSSADCKDLHLHVPLHARYPIPHSRDVALGHLDLYHRYNMEDPSIILRCNGTLTSQGLYKFSTMQSDLHWTVPAGLAEHSKALQYWTLLVAFGSLFAVFAAICMYKTTGCVE